MGIDTMKREPISLWPALRVVLEESFDGAAPNLLRAATFQVDRDSRFIYHTIESWLESCIAYGAPPSAREHANEAIQLLVAEMFRKIEKRRETYIADDLEDADRIAARLTELMQRYGFAYAEGRVIPIELQIPQEMTTLSKISLNALREAISRYSRGDRDGAMTMICTAVDEACASAPGFKFDDPFHKRVLNAYANCERALSKILDFDSNKDLCDAQKRSVNGTGYVLQKFRAQYSDVHQTNDAPAEVVQCAFDSAVFLLRTLAPRR